MNSKDESILVIAENEREKLVCRDSGLKYIPDQVSHEYGDSKRKPLEDWFLDELRFFETAYPGYSIFTLGSSLVFGEKFVTYLTICEFSIGNEKEFSSLVAALKSSDQAIRRKLAPAWKWDMAARKGNNIVFVVGWLDFAYFLQHRTDFLDTKHRYYMSSFMENVSQMKSKDFKVLQDGSIVPFDEKKLNQADTAIYKNYKKIDYERITKETLA